VRLTSHVAVPRLREMYGSMRVGSRKLSVVVASPLTSILLIIRVYPREGELPLRASPESSHSLESIASRHPETPWYHGQLASLEIDCSIPPSRDRDHRKGAGNPGLRSGEEARARRCRPAWVLR
jgi:hypothetical protein